MSDDSRVCAACGASVSKRLVHKNRYSQYICRQCRAAGIKAVGPKSLRYLVSRVPMMALGVAGVCAVVVVLVLVGVSETASHAEAGGSNLHPVQGIKGVVHSLNRLAH